jgi:hypothetical protein
VGNRLVVLAAVFGCRSESTPAPEPVSSVPVVVPVATLAAKVTTQLTNGEFDDAASTLADVRYDNDRRELPAADIKARRHDLALQVADTLVSRWEAIRTSELKLAEERGVARARGLAATRPRLPGELAWLAAESPTVAARWTVLEPELTKAEQVAFDRESTDPRPLVWVRPKQEDGVMVMDCVASALRTRFPRYRWVETGALRDGEPTLWIVSSAGKDTYSNTATHDRLEMLSALEVQLVADNLAPELTKHFRTPITSRHSTRSPDEIASVAGTAPVMEATMVGKGKLAELTAVLCASLGEAIASAR